MKLAQVVLTIILSIAAAFITTQYVGNMPTNQPAHETAYDRVMRTKTLRCGYIPYSYVFKIDPRVQTQLSHQ